VLPRVLSVLEAGGAAGREVDRRLYERAGEAITIGVTGAPGTGKSTLVDRMIAAERSAGTEVGVLAVDPTSPFSGGALLGDRVRMMDHALDAGVFVRSMATRGHLGGLAAAARGAIRALEAAGFGLVLVETVGVGQVEVEIAGAADTTIVVLNPGTGDSVQASKAGLLEVADVFVINKADRPGVQELERDLQFVLDLGGRGGRRADAADEWRPPVLRAVATTGDGISAVIEAVQAHARHLADSGELAHRRARRAEQELSDAVAEELRRRSAARSTGDTYAKVLAEVQARRLDPYTAAEKLLSSA